VNDTAFYLVILLLVVALVAWAIWRQAAISKMSPDERAAMLAKRDDALAKLKWGPRNPKLICPHCQAQGQVRTQDIQVKKGVSGGKATAAVLTGGLSLLATGLSRKQAATQAHCDNCGSDWQF
jgi:transcription elongation factor Elf1